MRAQLLIIILALSPALLFAETQKPTYTLNSYQLIGPYDSTTNEQCIDGMSLCEVVDIFADRQTMRINFGERGWDFSERNIDLQETSSGVLVFSRTFNDDCDDAGCANVIKISGVIYPKKVDKQWVPQVKAQIQLECANDLATQDGGCDPEEEYTYTLRFRKK